MNGMQQGQPNMHSWHAMHAVADRQKVVQILSSSLKEIQGVNFDMQKATTMAQEFEKFTFMKSQSRDEYLRLIKQKIAQLRGSMRGNAGGGDGVMGQHMGGNMAAQHGAMSGQNMGFVQQQAQNRTNAAQMQPQMRNGTMTGPQSQPHPGQQNMAPNAQQIQQISNLIRNSPIPQALLSKIPNIPSNVNTWSQIFDCFQKKIIPATAMPLVKEIHNAHIQLAIRQHQQQKLNHMQNPRMGSGQPQQQQQQQQPHQQPNMGHVNATNGMGVSNNNNNQMMNNMGNYNMNNLTPQQKQQLLQRQMQQRNSHGGHAPQMLPQGGNLNQQQSPPQQQQPQPQNQPQTHSSMETPNLQITAQDIMKYSTDALNLLTRLQNNGSIQQNLDQSQKESFIKKYIIHEKTQLWKQKSGVGNGTNVGGSNANPIMAQVQRLSQQGQMPMQQAAQRQQPMHKVPQSSPMMNNMNMAPQQPVMKSQPQMGNLASPLMNQRVPANPMANATPGNVGMNNTNINNGIPGNNMMNQQRSNVNANQQNMASILPPMTDDIKMKLKQLVEEVSGNNVALKDVTMLLSIQDKNTVREAMIKISQQYANVDSIISYFFLITRNIEGTKRLIQMKYMTKNIIENLQRGIFLAAPDLLEKLRSQYQKYFDYVKEQFAIRRQQLQVHQNQGAQTTNNHSLNHPSVPQMPPQTQQRMPPQQQPMNLGPTNSWPNVGMQPQQWNNMSSSPFMPNGSPVIPGTVPPQPQMQQKPPSRSSVSQTKKTSTGSANNNNATSGAARRKASTTKNAIANTNAANIATPASLNTIKTPNSIPTPHVPNHQSSKNTPNSQSPAQTHKAAPKISTPDVAEIFVQNKADAKLAKRRELSKSDPEKFFLCSMANLLELDDSTVDTVGATVDPQNLFSLTKSPLSPELGSGEWTCEIKPLAITTAFQQVDAIKDYVADNIIDSCIELSSIKSESDTKASKRSNDEMLNDFYIDNLFEDKKIKLEGTDATHLYETVDFDSWKDFVVSSIHSKG